MSAPLARVPHGYQVVLRLTVATLSLLVLAGSGVAWTAYQGFNGNVPHGAAVPALASGQRDLDGKDQNILLIGNDSRDNQTPDEVAKLNVGYDGGSASTDTTMLLHVPADGSRATIISLPRDSWVTIPGFGKGKLNAAYADGYTAAKNKHANATDAKSAGIELLTKTLSGLTGLHIDHYVQVDLLGFYKISQVIGGVRVCLLHAQNATTDADAYRSGYSGINLPAGWSTIEGTQALAFVRQRHGLPNGDLDRIKRQQYFLSAAFKKISSGGTLLNPFRLRSLMNAVSGSLFTDPDLDLISFARQFAELSSGNITFATLPNDGPQTIYPDGVMTSIVGVNTAAIPGFINMLLGKQADTALASAPAADPKTVTADVLNGTSTAGLAAQNAAALRERGFKVEAVDSADSTADTTVEYPDGMQAQAKAVAAAAPGATMVLTSSVKRVTLILGGDGVRVAAPTTASAAPKSSQNAPTPPPAAAAPAAVANCIN